jgi:hypothetical protein
MPQKLHELEIREVSLVDNPANSSVDPTTGKKTPRARIALFKRDDSTDFDNLTKEEGDLLEDALFNKKDGKTYAGTKFPKGDFAYTPDEVPSHWKLRLTKTPGGDPDPGIVGAAVAALGKGFRGNKVQIPSADLPSVKAKVRAAWKKANPEKGGEELPEILKGETTMTLQEIEAKVTKQDGILAQLTLENEVLKKERELVIKMSKKQRKAYASMSPEMQKDFMAGDEAKRKAMCDTAMKSIKEKALEDSMDAACKVEYAKAGPGERIILLAKQEEINKAADSEGGSNEDDMDKKKKLKAAKLKSGKKPEDDDDDDDDDDDTAEDDKDLELKRKLAKSEDRVTKLETQVSEVQKKERLEHFTKRAELELPNTSGSPVEKGEHLMQLANAMPGGETGDLFKKYMADMVNADKAMTIHFGEAGKPGGSIPAEKAFMAKADEIAKRDNISQGKAVAKVMDESPDLYIAYEQQQRMLHGVRA